MSLGKRKRSFGVQLSLFDASPIARQSDPETSQIAAADIEPKLSGCRREFVERLRVLGAATAQEVADGNETIRKRAKECERMGWIVNAGARRCRVTGKMATVYRARIKG